MNNKNIIEIKDLRKEYEDGTIRALNGINLEIKKGESSIHNRPIRFRKIHPSKHDWGWIRQMKAI